MRRVLHASLLTGSIVAGVFAIAGGPAVAQDQMYATDQSDSAIGLDAFSSQLAPYGYWLYSDRWGLVWQPGQVSADFHPYFSDGHWVYTDDYGWYWRSNLPWGDIAFHYGRWVDDPDNGWLWIPGYVWSPGWVVWRSNGQYIGWMPMPPDEAFLSGHGNFEAGVSFHFGVGAGNGFYGYSRWYPHYSHDRFARNWVFVGLGKITAPSYRSIAVRNPAQVIKIINNTRNVTNYTVINNHVVNKSVNVKIVERAAGHPVRAVRAASVIRNPRLVTSVEVGRRVQMRVRSIAPHGSGVANSAPPPPARIVAKLSTHAPVSRGNSKTSKTSLFTKTTVSAPQAKGQFHGKPANVGEAPNGQTAPNGQGPGETQSNTMSGPNGQQPNGKSGPGGEQQRQAPPNRMTGPNGEQPNGTNGPGNERHRQAPPNAMTGPNSQQPNGMSGPGSEQHHQSPPNGMTGPNGEQPNGANGPGNERKRQAPPNAMTGPNGQQPNGKSGPGTEQHRQSPPNGMTGPNGEQPNGTNGPGSERRRQTPPTGMTGTNGEQPSGSNGPGSERHRQAPPNAMTGPNGEQPNGTNGPSGERHRQAPPNGMTGPNGEQPNGTKGPRGEPPRQAQPGGTSGPSAEQRRQQQGQQQQEPQSKQHKKDQTPPNPPQ